MVIIELTEIPLHVLFPYQYRIFLYVHHTNQESRSRHILQVFYDLWGLSYNEEQIFYPRVKNESLT